MKEHDVVRTRNEIKKETDTTGHGLTIPKGTQGTIVHVHNESAFEVEFSFELNNEVVLVVAEDIEVMKEV